MISGRLTLVIREKTASILTTFPFPLNILSGRKTYRQGLQNAWGKRVLAGILLPSTVLPRQLAVS